MAKEIVLVIVLVAALAAGIVFFPIRGMLGTAASKDEVIVLCGGSMRAPLEEIIDRYAEVSDHAILANYGGSGELCAQIQKTGMGDIYICHDPFMAWAADRGLIDSWAGVGYLDVVIIVPKGNPKKIGGLKDLAQPDLRLGVGNRIYSTSGVIANNILKKLDCRDDIIENIRMETKGHQQRCTDVAMGTLDASIVWGPVAELFTEKLDIIPIPVEYVDAVTSPTYGKSDLRNVKVTIGITSRSKDKPAAREFYEFATSECEDVFRRRGFRTSKR